MVCSEVSDLRNVGLGLRYSARGLQGRGPRVKIIGLVCQEFDRDIVNFLALEAIS